MCSLFSSSCGHRVTNRSSNGRAHALDCPRRLAFAHSRYKMRHRRAKLLLPLRHRLLIVHDRVIIRPIAGLNDPFFRTHEETGIAVYYSSTIGVIAMAVILGGYQCHRGRSKHGSDLTAERCLHALSRHPVILAISILPCRFVFPLRAESRDAVPFRPTRNASGLLCEYRRPPKVTSKSRTRSVRIDRDPATLDGRGRQSLHSAQND